MKLRNILLLGVLTGIGIAVAFAAYVTRGLNDEMDVYNKSTDHPAADSEPGLAPDDAVQLGGEPIRGGEFRGPDNPAPQTERWYDIRAEEAIDVLGTDVEKGKLTQWVLDNTEAEEPKPVNDAVTRVLTRET